MSKDSWKTVAIALANRLSHARTPDCDPVDPDCPFCRDYLAYERFTERLSQDGERVPDPLAGARSVPVRDIAVGSKMRLGGEDFT